jgi:riboflavin synthase
VFTGLIKEVGKVKKITKNEEGILLEIFCPKLISEIKIDDSIAVNGVCLTATKVSKESFLAQAIHVTLEKTITGNFKTGDPVNLELALRASDRLGGHMVQGHVNTTAKLINIESSGDNYQLRLELNQSITPYVVQEGSIAINGISLTLSKLTSTFFEVSIIPHTWEVTNLKNFKVGDLLNIEVDMMAKYLEKFLTPYLQKSL